MQQKRRPCLGIWRVVFFLLMLTPTTASAGTRELTVVNIETPQAVKIWEPTTITVKKGDTVKLKLINKTEQEHGYRIVDFKVEKVVQGGQAETVEFTADKEGIFTIDCQLHPAHVQGQLIVLP
ncbi:MAG TPA: cupredoxin domain-containing protein [Methylomirabilota bacterium]|nr:cupredoxin domain-containing protein [Methylomirabilota bacterium]